QRGRVRDDAELGRLVEGNLLLLHGAGLDRGAGGDVLGRDDDVDKRRLALPGGLLRLLDQVERGAAGDNRKYDAHDDHELASTVRVLVFHLHRGSDVPPGLRQVRDSAGSRAAPPGRPRVRWLGQSPDAGSGVDMGAWYQDAPPTVRES